MTKEERKQFLYNKKINNKLVTLQEINETEKKLIVAINQAIEKSKIRRK